MLEEVAGELEDDMPVLDKIEHIAKIRYSLGVVASVVFNLYSATRKPILHQKCHKDLFSAAASLHEISHSLWPR